MTKSELEELLQNKEEEYTIKLEKLTKDLENKEKKYESVKKSMNALKQESEQMYYSLDVQVLLGKQYLKK